MGWADRQGKCPDIEMPAAIARSPPAYGLSDQTKHPFYLGRISKNLTTTGTTNCITGDALMLG